jgi:hypothetical protein
VHTPGTHTMLAPCIHQALFRKNLTSQKRQPGVNICVLLLTALMMSILVLLKVLPGLIGEPQTFVCGTNITSERSHAAPTPTLTLALTPSLTLTLRSPKATWPPTGNPSRSTS